MIVHIYVVCKYIVKKMPFPVIKLGYIAIKQISKPLARLMKEKAKNSPFFRNHILIKPAQGQFTVKFESLFVSI